MKSVRLLLILLISVLTTHFAVAQRGNEWIDYNKSYWKIKVGAEGIYRVSLSALPGVPAGISGANFILFRGGQEVPLLTTTNGSMSTSDYLEFYGKKADGSLDKLLYEQPSFQPDDRISLFSDTAVYFLTYDNQTNHQRYGQAPNNIPGTPPAPQAFCMATTGSYFLRNFCEGRIIVSGEAIHQALFDNAEGYVDTLVPVGAPLSYTLPAPNAVNAPVNASFNGSVVRMTFEASVDNIKVYLNNQQIADSTLPVDATKHFSLSVPAALVSSSNTISFTTTTTTTKTNEYGVSYLELQYPRDFNMNNASYFRFRLPASGTAPYLEFSGFSSGGQAPRLCDLTSKRWYAGDLAQPGKVRFSIDPAFTEREFILFSVNGSEVVNITAAIPHTFRNFRNASQQGDYLLISHSSYDASENGRNYLTEYKNYRNSPAGGGYQATIVDVQEIYDQFGYGYDIHPLSIRRFLKYAFDSFSIKPRYAFFVGKGLLYRKYRTYLQNPGAYPYAAIVPTYGDPGSDNDFANFLPNRMQGIAVGRFSAWTRKEVGDYLEKVKSYESALATSSLPTLETEAWKKMALHMAGGDTKLLQDLLLGTLNISKDLLEDTAYGGVVTTISKNTANPRDIVNSQRIDSLVNSGLSLVAFNGHATSNGFDFSLKDPETYSTVAKFPHFIALGCDIAQIFNLNSAVRTLSERHLLTPVGGSISVIASNNAQYPDFHRVYLPTFYNSITNRNYGGTIGQHQEYAYDSLRLTYLNSEKYFYHLESLLLQGDPALPVFGPAKPDYHISSGRLSSIPANVTNTMDSFTFRIVAFNLGRALRDTVSLKVEHINPAGALTVLKSIRITNLFFSDTLELKVGINATTDIGLNKYRVTIDDNNHFDEISEANNTGTLDVFIYSDNLVPIYPREFAIVHQTPVTLKASTLNPFRAMGRYRLQIDTTELFNSALKQETTVSSSGGVIKWNAPIALMDSTVYYWRTTYDSAVNGSFQWSNSSFIYLANGSDGWNQSHYFQYLKNAFNGLDYGSDRRFRYPVAYNEVTASNAIYADLIPNWPWNTADFVKVMMNGTDIQRLGCYPWDGTLQINVFDSVTNLPWKNDSLNGTSGSYPVCLNTRNYYTFEFPINTPQGRANAAHFLDSIPHGDFVLVRNIINLGQYDTTLVSEWKADPGAPLYQSFVNLGFTEIDSFDRIRPFIFFRKKGDASYPVYQYFGQTILDTLVKTFQLPTLKPNGSMTGVTIGPAKAWEQLKWRYSSNQNPQNDRPTVQIYGLNNNNSSTLLYDGIAKDTSLSFIDAATYPNIRLVWNSLDSIDLTSPQLDYWRVMYSPVPEAALNPNAWFVYKDSVQAGEFVDFSVAIENLTELPMDSMLVRYKIIDGNNNSHVLSEIRYKKLRGNDTLHAGFSFDPRGYGGNNYFFVEANPDNDQPEQYHPNNLGYLPLRVEVDQRNPLIDVTFDGVHILDRDIVSAKPFIKIVLRDENKYLKLDDTSLLQLRLRYPSDVGSSRNVSFDGSICKFVPAQNAAENNRAIIEFRPDLPEEGIYELYVNGKDKTGNQAGSSDYQISFEVVHKSTITNVLNYPNPFSTSTAFLFTLTGAEIPTQFKIQIMTVTGKVVREITRQEIGPIHVGRNITEYKWDGRDQYGQLLGNGVYFYRVVTSINGNSIEHRADMDLNNSAGSNQVDKFFKNGYGKMYIMR